MLNLRKRISGRLHQDDLYEICYITQGASNDHIKEKLYKLAKDEDDKVAYNALWAFSHFDQYNNEWLYAKHNELIDMAMTETHDGKKRLLLTLLLRQPFYKDNLRTDFINFCFGKIIATAEKYAVRALCIKLAYEQCRFYPELLDELRQCLDMLSSEPLSSGLKTAMSNVLKKMKH